MPFDAWAEVIDQDPKDEVFGLSLREVVKLVVGFRVETTPSSGGIRVVNIVELPAGEAEPVGASSVQTELRLMEGEYVERVYYTTTGNGHQSKSLRSVQFQTNLRTSQWFGAFRAGNLIRNVAAGRGQVIHSLRSTTSGVLDAVSSRIRSIQNFTLDESRESLRGYVANGSKHLFLLYPGEYITKVEVASSDVAITGLRVHTSAPWFGNPMAERTFFQADDGFCINAFRGVHGSTGITQLVVVFVPLEVAQEGHHRTLRTFDSDLHFISDDHEYGWTLRTGFSASRAIVIHMLDDDSIGGVRVVSCAEYDRFVHFDGPLDRNQSEHWVVQTTSESRQSLSRSCVNESPISSSRPIAKPLRTLDTPISSARQRRDSTASGIQGDTFAVLSWVQTVSWEKNRRSLALALSMLTTRKVFRRTLSATPRSQRDPYHCASSIAC